MGKVTVSYSLYGLAKSVTLVSNFAPPGIESTTGGGTLSLHVVNASGANVGDANVQIVNASTSPAVNLATFTDANGLVVIGGAATSSQYQIYVSHAGYSSAQTYARTSQNVNPTPGYLTVVKNQTTSATFAIDTLATLTLSSFSPATTTVFTDTFASAANLASQTNTQVAGGALDPREPGALRLGAFDTDRCRAILDGWGILSATLSQPSGTTALIHVDDTSGAMLPDSVLPGNSAGFSSFPVSLTGIATSSYPGLTLEADLTSNATTTTPSVLDWSLSHTEGPSPLPNISFTLTGAKTIGTNGSGQPIYKTIVSDTTGASATKTETLEWDAYSLALPGTNFIESCPKTPYPLAPSQASSTALIVGALTANTLPLVVTEQRKQYHTAREGCARQERICGDRCPLPRAVSRTSAVSPPATYSATVSAAGHTTKVFSNITSGTHRDDHAHPAMTNRAFIPARQNTSSKLFWCWIHPYRDHRRYRDDRSYFHHSRHASRIFLQDECVRA